MRILLWITCLVFAGVWAFLDISNAQTFIAASFVILAMEDKL